MFNLTFLEEHIKKLEERNKKIKAELEKMGHNIPDAQVLKPNTLRFTTEAKSLKELKVACVMDRFTFDSYKYECNIMQITPDNWKNEIDEFKPDILFIESAWEGKDKLWFRKIANGSKEFFEMASYCQDKNVPIILWNKEDPIYTDTFMPVARMSDFVFTTDIDCVKKYKDELGHDNVFHLHFAAQPAIHNPIDKYERKEKFCFAGAYYHKYKQRSEIFDKFSEIFIKTKGFDIYDRNYKSALPEHAFPSRYDKYILGKLDPSEIDIAYKGYYYGINMNSVSQSQTMFARRVFEMLASNTITVGNYSRGVKNLFGDLTICTDDSQEMERQFNFYCNDKIKSRKYRLIGLRSVLSQHLYEDRLDYIVTKVFGKSLKRKLPQAVLFTDNESVIENFKKQTYENKILYVVGEKDIENGNIIYVTKEKAAEIKVSSFKDAFVGVLDGNNYYGRNYLKDMLLSLRYGNFNGVAKNAYYLYENGVFKTFGIEAAYKPTNDINIKRGLVSSEYVDLCAADIFENTDLKCSNGICIDEFNFCENYTGSSCKAVDDIDISDIGISMDEIQKAAEKIRVNKLLSKGEKIKSTQLENFIKKDKLKKLTVGSKGDKLEITSSLSENENEYIYFEKLYNVADFASEGNINFMFDCTGGFEVLGVCIFSDKNKNKISAEFPKVNRFDSVHVPDNAVYFKLGLRIRGGGNISFKSISVGIDKSSNEAGIFLSRSNVLVLTNQYPSYNNLYRNMFVHKRMTAYKEDGNVYDVMRMNIYAKDGFREFEGINVVEGYCEKLENVLSTGKIDTVCVHFLDKQMWDVLKEFKNKIRIIVWSHGADIQPWWRREFIFRTKEELEKGKKDSEIRMSFWKEIFDSYKNYNMSFVFVSEYAANIVMEDYKINIDKERLHIIPNFIDTENMFNYIEKDSEQRKNIISIRPYSSKIYGNDLMVSSVLEFSKKDYFKDLKFTVIGNGDLFDEIVAPLRKFRNVSVEKKFLRQNEIADLYKQNGIVLIPTRGDTQGVSRDEAMSSGLVPVTNKVAAIPEFVDENCGILAGSEDYMGMVDGIEKLYNNPEEFLRLSKNAAQRVRNQSSKEFTIVREEKLINSN